MELSTLLKRMKMEHLLAQLDGVCEHATKGDLNYKRFLTQALEAEWYENRLDRTLQQLTYLRVLILDQLGYLPLTREEASLFFRLLVRRYERAVPLAPGVAGVREWAVTSP